MAINPVSPTVANAQGVCTRQLCPSPKTPETQDQGLDTSHRRLQGAWANDVNAVRGGGKRGRGVHGDSNRCVAHHAQAMMCIWRILFGGEECRALGWMRHGHEYGTGTALARPCINGVVCLPRSDLPLSSFPFLEVVYE